MAKYSNRKQQRERTDETGFGGEEPGFVTADTRHAGQRVNGNPVSERNSTMSEQGNRELQVQCFVIK